MLIATKTGKSVTNHEEVPLIKSHGDMITWSFEIMWQTKNVPPLPQSQWLQNLVGW